MKRRRLFRMERGPCRPWNGAKSGSRLIRRIGNAYPMGKWSRFRQRPASQAGADAVDGLADVLDAVGVGEADIAFAELPEAGAGDSRDAGFFEVIVLQRLGREAGAFDIGEGREITGEGRVGKEGGQYG